MATEMNKTYNPSEIEDRLYKKWMDKKYFHAEAGGSWPYLFNYGTVFCS